MAGGLRARARVRADLFDDARLAAVPMQLEHTAEELNALLGTMSFWAGSHRTQRDALVAENQALLPPARPADPLEHRSPAW